MTTARCFIAPTIRAEEAAEASELFYLTGSKAEEVDLEKQSQRTKKAKLATSPARRYPILDWHRWRR